MLFVIHGLDKKSVDVARKENSAAHFSYLAEAAKRGVKIVMSGPLVTDDGSQSIGSHFIVEASDRATVENFHRNDPFYIAGIWSNMTITAFNKKYG